VNYEAKLKASWVGRELRTVRNINGSFSRGLVPGLLHTWLSTVLTRGYEPWTLRKSVPDHQMTKRAVDCEPIEYPKPDGVLSFPLLANLQRSGNHGCSSYLYLLYYLSSPSGTAHEADQPSHLVVKSDLSNAPSGKEVP